MTTRSWVGFEAKYTDGYNLLRGALAWFDSHEVEKKLGHLPQWVVSGRELLAREPNPEKVGK